MRLHINDTSRFIYSTKGECIRSTQYVDNDKRTILDYNTLKLLYEIPFNYHGVFHLRPRRQYDIKLVKNAFKRFFRGVPVIAFEDSSDMRKAHIHWLICLCADKEPNFFNYLKQNHEKIVSFYNIFQNIPLLSPFNRHIQPIRTETKKAIDYVARNNIPVNTVCYVSNNLTRSAHRDLKLNDLDIRFRKSIPYKHCLGYSCAPDEWIDLPEHREHRPKGFIRFTKYKEGSAFDEEAPSIIERYFM